MLSLVKHDLQDKKTQGNFFAKLTKNTNFNVSHEKSVWFGTE